MSYNITLSSSMRSNLLSLRNIATQMSKTQNILSTGKKVNNAIDNASAYYQARSLTQRAGDLNSLLDSMSQGIQALQAATQGIEAATSYLEQAKAVAEQALNVEERQKILASQVELIYNASTLQKEGYKEVYTSDDLINSLSDNAKIVLMNDIELDSILDISNSNIIINGGGHSINISNENSQISVSGENISLKNMLINHTGKSNTIINSSNSGFFLENVNINHETTDSTNTQTIILNNGGTLKNVNINTTSTTSIVGVNCGDSKTNIKNLTMKLTSNDENIIGINSIEGDIDIDGISIITNSENAVGIMTRGSIAGIKSTIHMNQSVYDGYTNTQIIVNQVGASAKAAYCTTQYYVGDKDGEFGQEKWYLPSIGELMELHGTDFDSMTTGNGDSAAKGYNLKAINATLTELAKDGIAEKMNGHYWSSTEYNASSAWLYYTSVGSRYYTGKANPLNVRSLMTIENCFNQDSVEQPKIGDIMYLDGSWGTLEGYNSSKAEQVAGVICDVNDDGSVKIVSLKDLTYSSSDDSGTFDPENPYGGAQKSNKWSTTATNINDVSNIMPDDLLYELQNPYSISTIEDVNDYLFIDATFYSDQFNNILSEYDKLIKDASYQGINLLSGGEMKIIFNETRSHEFLVKGKDISSNKLGLKTTKWINRKELNKSIDEIKNAIEELRNLATDLGNKYTIIQTRQNFTEVLSDILETGADDLILADMNETSAEYLMLQTRQQLAVNSLSLASQSASSILNLF